MPRTTAVRAYLLLIGRFLVVYLPTFAIIGAFRMSIARTVPVVIILTFALASVLMLIAARGNGPSMTAFGFRRSPPRFVAYSIALGAPLGLVAALLLNQFREPGPLAGLDIAPWLAFVYFGLAAPVQEEAIFRGLLQTGLAADLIAADRTSATANRIAVLVVAFLFAATHLFVGPLTAGCATVLGLLAGELRWRSESLFPAVCCHSLFNLAGLFIALPK
jgi:membrane protease YdiL (CAAX protease family)